MSTGGHIPAESSGTAFAFVRPMPGKSRLTDSSMAASPTASAAGPVTRGELSQILFPPKSSDSSNVPPVTGVHLGHFVVEERIGRGGMGAVFRAIDTRLNRVVALKVLTPQQSNDPAAVQRFHNEARAAAQLDHDHIARVHYIGEDRGLYFIAFEFVSGTNVRDVILRQGRLKPEDAVNYTLQIVEALRHTSAQSVVHRDIKPSNIILSAVGRVKLVDLGLARQIHPNQSESEDLTVAGTALGTFDYISPEQAIDARDVDVRSDIYSLGCTLYHMLTGEPPYPRGSMFEKVIHHHGRTPPDPALKNPLVSPELSQVVRKMMASDRDERYATPDELLAALAHIADSMGLVPQAGDGYTWTLLAARDYRPSPWEGSKIWVGLLGILLLAAIFLDGTPWSGQPTDSTATSGFNNSLTPAFPTIPSIPPVDGNADAVGASSSLVAPPRPESPSSIDVPPPAPATGTNGDSKSGVLAALAAWDEINQQLAGVEIPSTPELVTPQRTVVPEPVALPDGTLSQPTPENMQTAVPSNGGETVTVIPSEGGTSTTTGAEPGVVPTAKSPFVVIDDSGARHEHATLFAALAKASDNAVIELQFDGRSGGRQEPLKLTGKNGIRVRPAANYRPVLEFALTPNAPSQQQSAVRMISLVDAGIEFYDLDLEMWVSPQSSTDRWSLFSVTGRSDVVLRGCSCTIVNPTDRNASVFDLPERESVDVSQMMKDRMKAPRFQLRLEDSVVRGQADFVRQGYISPASVSLQNVALGISGHLISVDGSNALQGPPSEENEDVVDLSLNHVTAILGDGLLWASSGNFGRLPQVEVDAHDSLFSVTNPERPFVELHGHEELDELAEQFVWQPNRDPNFFELVGPMWFVNAPNSLGIELERRFNFSDWSGYWQEQSDQLIRSGLFRNPRLGMLTRMDRIESSDFVLRSGEITPNPAVGSSSDRQNCGVDWTLPRIPRALPLPPGF
ncbi:MAG: protein kinase [Planctomycetaceae bacterium]|nr:protein kinase [Planctomycetaceae bacterium]